MGNILLKNISVGDAVRDILITGETIGKIADAGTLKPTSSDTEVMDCDAMAAVPGFINMHTHAAMTLLRGFGEDITFRPWLSRIWELEACEDAEFVYWGTKLACLEMIKTGTTCFNDHYWFPESAARAASEMGLRAFISYVILDNGNPMIAPRLKDECMALEEISHSWPDTIRLSAAFHSVYTVSQDMILWCSEFARRHSLNLHIHLSETTGEVSDCISAHGYTPVGYLDDLGVLGPEVVAAHTLHLTRRDIEILAERGVSCVHNINSNLKLSSGYKFPYTELSKAGANICIGTDGCASSNNLDILEAMKTSAIVQKAWRGDPSVMTIDELMRMSSASGAKALGINAGVIAEGALADISIVNTDSSFFLSNAPFLANFIYSAHSDCIDSVICNGRFLMKNRVVPGEEEILRGARSQLSKINRKF
ncbi:MAG: amidohydrolase [Bacteroidales bacterium]|nr:amidohydrolase [Bacteroidales bacterium]